MYKLIKGTVIGHCNGYGFLRVQGREKDLYLSSKQMKKCIHGDQVLAQILKTNQKGCQEAHIVRVLIPKTSQIIGQYFFNSGIGFVVPKDSRMNFNIFIPSKGVMDVRTGFMVVVELIQRPTRDTRAIGRIIEKLSNNLNTNTIVNMTLHNYEIPYIWPKDVKKQIKEGFKKEVKEIFKTDRIDLRNLPLITIDGEDALDFDDAIFCKEEYGIGWHLWVAIADVSYYVRPNTPLDNEARNRGNSVYFPSQVIPMLPEILSNDLCSLNPKVDRLCMVCEMTISLRGNLINYRFYEAIINSRARLTYTKVLNILQGHQETCEQYSELVQHIEKLHNLSKTLEKARESRGGLSFERERPKLVLNSDYRIEYIEKERRNDAHKLIEECMILTNISAACFLEKEKGSILFRVHDRPTTKSVTTLRSVLTDLGLKLSGGNRPKSYDYALLLKSTINRHDAEIVQIMLLRSMKQAIYHPENRGHFGLALRSYAHFTSPIRRYPDLLLHRVIKYLLLYKKKKGLYGIETGGYRYSIKEMYQLGQHCSMTERRADNAIHEVNNWLKCDFMLDKIGNTFQGIIFSVTKFGFFVRLNKLLIDGLVHISNLDNDYYHFDKFKQYLIGTSNRKIYRVGDYVKVRVKAVNMDERKIDFSIVFNKNIKKKNRLK